MSNDIEKDLKERWVEKSLSVTNYGLYDHDRVYSEALELERDTHNLRTRYNNLLFFLYRVSLSNRRLRLNPDWEYKRSLVLKNISQDAFPWD